MSNKSNYLIKTTAIVFAVAVFIMPQIVVAAPVISDLSISDITQTSATISWQTSEDTDGMLEFGQSSFFLDQFRVSNNFGTSHSISLSNLSPDTTYYIQVTSSNMSFEMALETGSFSTLANIPDEILGCTDSSANNYDPNATNDDGSCTYDVSGCTDFDALNFNPDANVDDDSCLYAEIDPLAISNIDVSDITQTSAVISWNTNADTDGMLEYGVDEFFLDQFAISFSFGTSHSIPLSSLTPDTTYYFIVTSSDFDFNMAISETQSFTTLAEIPIIINGCTDTQANNYNPDATNNDGSCTYDVLGCTDDFALNYNPVANVDDLSCIYPDFDPPIISDIQVTNITQTSANISWQTNEDSDGMLEYGVNEFFLDQFAFSDNFGTSHSIPLSGLIPDTTYYFVISGSDLDFNLGMSDTNSFTTLADEPDPILGCTDPEANNHNPDATVDDDSCTYDILGCTDDVADNYNAEANIDDDSCTYPEPDPILGCMDETATNYNSETTVDDETCTYPDPEPEPQPAPTGGGGGGGGGGASFVFSNVETSDILPDGAIITWLTNRYSTSRVVYGTTAITSFPNRTDFGYASSTNEITDKVTNHEINLLELLPATKYYWRAISKDNSNVSHWSTEQSFVTPQVLGAEYSEVSGDNLPVGGENPQEPSNSELIKLADSPKVYVVENGKKRWIPSEECFNARGYDWDLIEVVESDYFEGLPEIQLLKAKNDPGVYIIENNLKRLIPSEQAFFILDYIWLDVVVVSQDVLDSYDDLQIVKNQDDPKVYLLAGGKLKWIETEEDFLALGYLWNEILTLDKAVIASFILQ